MYSNVLICTMQIILDFEIGIKNFNFRKKRSQQLPTSFPKKYLRSSEIWRVAGTAYAYIAPTLRHLSEGTGLLVPRRPLSRYMQVS